jgi:uncharacterized protein YprB with RNaseH-like and TPR domain
VKKPGRILFFDIETAGVNALKSDLGFVVCFGYKFSDEPEAHCLTARKKDLRSFDDRWILEKASKLIEQADLIVGHYASVFDRRFLRGRLLINNLPPVPNTKMRDTVFIARAAANFSSNRLGHLSKILKLKHRKQEKGDGWPNWWLSVMQGDMAALAKMSVYCKADVLATEELYYRLLPFDNAHMRIVADRSLCGVCGGSVQYRGLVWANGNRYRRHVCVSCGRWDRETQKAVA